MPKAKKLKSGNWNVIVYDYTDEEGKRHYRSFTAATKAQVLLQAAQFSNSKGKATRKPQEITVREAIDRYIAMSEVLSPTTIQGYEKIKRFAFQSIMKTQVKKLDDETLQLAINMEAKRTSETTGRQISAKTVKNEWGLLSSALRNVCGRTFQIKLPSVQRKIKEYPEPSTVLQAIIGSSIELPCMLAIWLSFSLSEIRGIMCSSVRDGYIHIDRVMVIVNGESVLKETAKTETRLRKHRIPPYIMQLIEQSPEYKDYQATGRDQLLVPLTHNQIEGRWKRLCKKNNIDLPFHGLRHMNASIMLMLNIPEKYAMERGGWKTPHIMQSVYQHTFSDERRQVDDLIDTYFERLIRVE